MDRTAIEASAAKRMSQCRTKLVLGSSAKAAYFAPLAMRLRLAARWDIPTMATDGTHIFYNPSFAMSLKPAQCVAVICHEVLHCVFSHFARRENRPMDRANIAMDLAINPILKDWQFDLPKGCVWPEQFGLEPMKSFEWYYNHLPQGAEGGGGSGEGGWNVGGVMDGPAKARQLEKDWQEAGIRAAEAARKRGTLPGALEAFVGELLRPAVTWPEYLRNFILTKTKDRMVWCPPSKRFVHSGLYVPSMRGEDIGNLYLTFDTSGSMGQAELLRCLSEVAGITEQYSAKLWMLFHDMEVYHVAEWQSSDGPLPDMPQLRRGGTSHVDAFAWLRDNAEDPTAIICFTDLETQHADTEPDCPVLWAHVGGGKADVPWGEVIEVDLEDRP